MKKLLMIVTIGGFIAGTNLMAANTKCGDDKDKNKKCSKECCKKGAKEGKACCKKNMEQSESSTASNGDKKACCKKSAKAEEVKPANTEPTK